MPTIATGAAEFVSFDDNRSSSFRFAGESDAMRVDRSVINFVDAYGDREKHQSVHSRHLAGFGRLGQGAGWLNI